MTPLVSRHKSLTMAMAPESAKAILVRRSSSKISSNTRSTRRRPYPARLLGRHVAGNGVGLQKRIVMDWLNTVMLNINQIGTGKTPFFSGNLVKVNCYCIAGSVRNVQALLWTSNRMSADYRVIIWLRDGMQFHEVFLHPWTNLLGNRLGHPHMNPCPA